MNEDLLALAKVRLEEILAFFQIEAKITVNDDESQVTLNIDTPTTSKLIGHRGETLRALQHLLNAIVRRQTAEQVYISLDVAGYKQAMAERIGAKAKEAAQKALDTGKEQYLRPMTAAERRVVHMALAGIPEVVTESIGEDPHRRVIIKKRP
jgi:spoIIIJ-associated protein